MGRNRKRYTDKFKIECARKALKSKSSEAEIAAQVGVAPSTLCEWIGQFIDGEIEDEKTKALRRENARLAADLGETVKAYGQAKMEIELLKKNEIATGCALSRRRRRSAATKG